MRRIQETALMRGFAVMGKGTFIGCYGMLQAWVTEEPSGVRLYPYCVVSPLWMFAPCKCVMPLSD